ncbi:centromere-associated protein E isoform X1 [Oreochromis niloticus]|uniref:Centromere-associated protein E n=1 Tax=Oreochromis niloticus TaxID=8128 RepID=A0A669EQQ4_ORENI|nr:centromere-associated protein E isoform X1 [Oreochromis niloticus]
MTEESAVKVCVRVRPLIAREESASENAEPVQIFWKADKKSIHQIDDGNSTKSFSFDRVFAADETTSQLYNDIAKPLVVSTVEGYNGTIFAYGQTSSGKTFTMMGTSRTPGVIPQAVEDVFQTIKNFPKKEFLLRVSYMEIYNETVTDLLVDSWKRKPLEVREQINKNIYVADLTEELVTSPAQVLAWIRKGEKNRHYGKTKMNQRSSRSHTIFRMILESRERSDPASGESSDGAIIVSHLNLVDLAGSERASQTGAEGARFKEGCNINRSLFTLGQVIKKLTDENQKGFTNYRDSKLTRILQNSLGGNAKTVIICTITPVTLDETLSTLQFASTAKKMKNDPHVTEVSDDGALLKRYRNEIAELKRRLHEVSSVTQTTVTEKEVLSQLLQEKDQLQREKEGLKRNLANLLVTSSNLVPVQKMPSRRVTWGGKMVKLAHPSAFVGSFSDLSFAESFTQKRIRSDFSCLMELGEDDEDFDSNWGVIDEPSDEMEMSRSSVTVRSFEDSPRDFMSPDRLQELSGKVSSLEMQLEQESQEKEAALSNLDVLKGRVAELQLQLETEVQHRQEALEKVQTGEQRRAELEALLHTEAQQRLEATQKADMLELRVTDLERQLGESSDANIDTNEQMRKEFAETIQLCETLASEKDLVAAERDYLKQELGMFIEQMERLEKEKAAVLQELEEKREMDEFKSLEEGCRKENEKELENEIVSLKKAVESSELQRMQLQNDIETLTEQLKKKETEFAHEMENLGSKDLVQEVLKLRRSLDDAELLSRDTRKDWAVLRSRSISLEETNVTLTASHEKMEAEVKSLRFQLETEKSRYRKMQSDLQKELNVAFDENTKLTTLLDGNVPKNLIDSIELERTVANLNKELMASRQVETALRAQLDELAACQTLPDKVDALVKQLEGSEQERAALEGKLSEVQPLMKDLEEKLADSEASRSTEEEISRELQEQISQLNEELRCVRAEKAELLSEQSAADRRFAEETEKLLSAVTSVTAERDELRVKLQEHVDKVAETQVVLQSVQDELQEQKEKNSDLVKAHEQKESDLGEKMLRLSQDLQCVRDEKEALLMTTFQKESEDVEKLSATLASVTAERDQLRTDMQENVEMMIENQEELRTALEQNREQKKQIKELEAQILKLDGLPSERNDQLVELQTRIKALTEELESVRAERDSLLSEKELSTQTSTEEMEKLLCRVTSVSKERDELQEILEGLRQEKQQLQAELEDRVETVQQLQGALQAVTEQKSQLEGDLQRSTVTAAETQSLMHSLQEQLEEQNKNCDLERVSQETQAQLKLQVEETNCLLQCLQEELKEQKQKLSDRVQLYEQKEVDFTQQITTLSEELDSARAERDALLLQKELESRPSSGKDAGSTLQLQELTDQIQRLTEELESVRAERDSLLSEKELSTQTSTEEMEKLLCRVTSVSEERDELQEILEGLRQEKQQLQAELEDRVETLQSEIRTLTDGLKMAEAEGARLLSEKELSTQTSTEEMEKLLCRVTSVSEERDELQEILEGLRQEKQQLQAELEDRVEMMTENQEELRVSQENIRILQDEMNLLKSEKAELESRPSSGKDAGSTLQLQELTDQIQRLTEELESVRAERDSLLSEKELSTQTSTEEMEKLLCRVTSVSEEKDELQEILEGLRQEKQQLRAELEDRVETLQSEIRTLTDALKMAEAEAAARLLSEKELSTQTSTEEMEKLLCRVTSVSEERDELWEILEGLRQEKQQLQAELEDRVEILQSEIRTLTDALKMAEAEAARLLSEKELSTQTSTEEMEKLLCRVTSVSEERDELQEILEGLRQEKQQLQAELEDRVQMISAIQDKLSQLEQLNMHQQSERGEQEAKLQQDILQLKEQVQMHTERRAQAESEADAVQQLLSEANATISALREQISRSEPSTSEAKELLSSRLQDSTRQLEESFKSFQQFIDTCCSYDNITQDKGLRDRRSLKHPLPKATKDAYDAVFQLGQSTDENLRKIQELLRVKALGYRNIFEELVKKDLAIFEERRLQDVLLCRAQGPSYSVQVEGFDTLWEQRLPELLDRRQLYMEKMSSILEKLWDNMTSYLHELKGEIQERFKFNKQLQVLITNQPISFSGLDSILKPETDRRAAGTQSKKCLLQSITDEQKGPFEELKQLEAEAETHLREVKSKSSTLLQALEDGAFLTVAALQKETQQLASQLKHAEEKVKALRIQNEQLEEAHIKADANVSNHKEATQLLQTELQDNRALVEEKENTIQALKSKIRESEKKTSPSVAELEKLQTKLLQLEMKLSSASDEHKREIQAMNTLLEEKEELLRKLKETLRKSQQEGEESFLQGKDLHARLTNPRSSVVSSSILMEKSKLEKEVSQLHMKITELESVVASQQAEITKWKNRAIKLKVKNKVEEDKLQSPSTPTKRGFPMTSDSSNLLSSPKKFLIPAKKLLDTPRKGLESPRKLLDSPKASLLESPKSRFFDVGGSSETLSRNCPKQFFDNSSLGTIPEVSRVPETAAPEQDVAVDTDKNEWWPKSPKQEEMCKTQ